MRRRVPGRRAPSPSERRRTSADRRAGGRVLETSATLLLTQNRVLELVAHDAPLHDTLDTLLRAIESGAPGMLASILLLDEDGVHIRHAAAPSLPASYLRAIDGQAIGPAAGSCGTAAFRREPVVVEDIATDPLWATYRDVALPHGLRACWSTPIRDGDGRVLGTFAMYFRRPARPTARHRAIIDLCTYTAAVAITAHQERQARGRLTEQLRQSQKIDSLGRLAGGVAHDFNNLLTVMHGHADLALQDLQPADPLRERLEDIRAAAIRASDLTGQLLAFSRRQMRQPRVVDLNASIADATRMLRRLLGEDIELVTVLEAEPATVTADRGQIDQVIVNLSVNARDAMPAGGRLTITTRHVAASGAAESSRPGGYVVVTFSDTGVGMDAEMLTHIFEPFFTTKAQGKGTGLGLSMVYGIVQQSDGWVSVASEPGQGTTFQVHLPSVAAPAEPTEVRRPSATRGGDETLLVVEDDPGVRKFAVHVLRRMGYRVFEAADGVEALMLCRQRAGPIPLLITDVVMPQMSGPDLAARLQATQPHMRVLYMSGYTDEAIARRGVGAGPPALLVKPFTAPDLLRAVREVLDAPA